MYLPFPIILPFPINIIDIYSDLSSTELDKKDAKSSMGLEV